MCEVCCSVAENNGVQLLQIEFLCGFTLFENAVGIWRGLAIFPSFFGLVNALDYLSGISSVGQ